MIRVIHNLRSTLVITLWAVLVCSCTEIDAIDDEKNAAPSIVDQLIPDLMTEHNIPGMAVAISHEDSSYFYNFGVLDRESGRAVTQDTLFEIGSVSKLFTVALAAQAEQEGVMTLDAPIGEYMSELAGSPLGELSVFHLATHTAGGFPLQLPAHVDTETSLHEYYRTWTPEYPAGTQRHYANPSIGLLGVLVARAQEESFVELMERKLFPSLGMRSTFIRVPDGALDSYAWGHNRKNEQVRVNPALLADEAYGVKTTSSDLMKFLQLNSEGAEASDDLERAIRRTHTGYYETEFFQQALIWEKYEYPIDPCKLKEGNSYKMIMKPSPVIAVDPSASGSAVFALSKTGSTDGFGAYVFIVPSENFALLLLANKNYPIGARVEAGYRLMAEFLPTNAEFCE